MGRGRGRPRKDNRPSFCMDCDKVHKHSDDVIFCRPLAARINITSKVPEHCITTGRAIRRVGSKIPKSSKAVIADSSQLSGGPSQDPHVKLMSGRGA